MYYLIRLQRKDKSGKLYVLYQYQHINHFIIILKNKNFNIKYNKYKKIKQFNNKVELLSCPFMVILYLFLFKIKKDKFIILMLRLMQRKKQELIN